jgi:glycosyltransferase involved in cell wall biosynthesis
VPAQKKILFVSHKANRSGAPVLLLKIIREFKVKTGLPIQVLVMEDGELVKEFQQLGQTFVWKKQKILYSPSLFKSIVAAFLRIIIVLKGLYILFRVRNTSLVFFNTITNGYLHKKLLFLNCRYVCYVHELEAAIHMLTNSFSLGIVLENTHLFLAVSNAVKNNLITNHNVNENSIKAVASPVTEIVRDKKKYTSFINSFKKANQISGDAVIIGVAAANEWRKGFDLFAPLATLYFNLYPNSNVYFAWKGFSKQSASSFFDEYDYKKHTAKDRMLLIPHGNNSIEQMASFDIHLLLSREDPYPLVVLEAASFAVPTVCFNNAGGTPEFIEEDAGYCIPYGNLLQMAKCLNELTENVTLRNKMGLNAQKKLAIRHDEKKAMNEIIALLENEIATVS